MQVFTVTTPTGSDFEQAAAFVRQLCPSARPTYALGGTQKYELPTSEVNLVICCAYYCCCWCQFCHCSGASSPLRYPPRCICSPPIMPKQET